MNHGTVLVKDIQKECAVTTFFKGPLNFKGKYCSSVVLTSQN